MHGISKSSSLGNRMGASRAPFLGSLSSRDWHSRILGSKGSKGGMKEGGV